MDWRKAGRKRDWKEAGGSLSKSCQSEKVTTESADPKICPVHAESDGKGGGGKRRRGRKRRKRKRERKRKGDMKEWKEEIINFLHIKRFFRDPVVSQSEQTIPTL